MKVEYRFEPWYFNRVLSKKDRDAFKSVDYDEQQRRLRRIFLHFEMHGKLIFLNKGLDEKKEVTINPVNYSVKTVIVGSITQKELDLLQLMEDHPFLKTIWLIREGSPHTSIDARFRAATMLILDRSNKTKIDARLKEKEDKSKKESKERRRLADKYKPKPKEAVVSINKYGATSKDIVSYKIKRKEVQPFKIRYYITAKFFNTLSLKDKLYYKHLMNSNPKAYQTKLENMYNDKHFFGDNPVGVSFTGDKKSYRMDEVYKLCFTKDEQAMHKRLSHTHTYYRQEDSSHVMNDIKKVQRRYHFTMSDHRCLYGHQYN